MKQTVTRIAPSPTGTLHVGTARSALFNYLFARQQNGKFIVRIEDTDQSRSTKEYEQDILEGLAWLGLEYDELYRQSERSDYYTGALKRLIDRDAAYISREPAKDEQEREVEVVRLRNPGERVTFQDLIRGEVSFDTAELGDFVIARSLHEPLYHLAVVVDDAEMDVTHVIRGEDHISNTPRQMLIQRALGYTTPHYAHIPMILAADRSKLSKRKGAKSIAEFRAEGYFADALVNYLALLGWNPGTEQELFSHDELVQSFSIEKVNKAGAIFSEEKLRWFNRTHVKELGSKELQQYIEPYFSQRLKELAGYNEKVLARALPLISERVEVASDVTALAKAGEFDFFFSRPSYGKELLIAKKGNAEDTAAHLDALEKMLERLEEFTPDTIKDTVWPYAEKHGRSAVLWPLRAALSGKEKSPDPFSIAAAIGREETIERLHYAQSLLSTQTT